jgi:hypothetical protein
VVISTLVSILMSPNYALAQTSRPEFSEEQPQEAVVTPPSRPEFSEEQPQEEVTPPVNPPGSTQPEPQSNTKPVSSESQPQPGSGEAVSPTPGETRPPATRTADTSEASPQTETEAASRDTQTPPTPDSPSGFISCEGRSCSACDFVVLGNTAIKWLITISFLFFAVLAVRAGIKLVTSQGNPGALSNAKESFTNAFIGLIIILLAFLLVDTIMRQLVKGSGEIKGYGPWNEVVCAKQVESTTKANYFDGDETFEARVTASGDNASSLPATGVASRVQAIRSTPQVTAMVDKALDEMGITDPYQRKIYRALISQESSNCTRETSPVGAQGCAQFMIPTAREYDAKLEKRFAGKSDAQVAQMLRDDDQYSIRMGARLFKDGLQRYNGNIDYALAAYNGGPGSVQASKSCPGLRIYQCDTATDGYQETRNYVANIKAVASAI